MTATVRLPVCGDDSARGFLHPIGVLPGIPTPF
jgi:hypothetical protein